MNYEQQNETTNIKIESRNEIKKKLFLKNLKKKIWTIFICIFALMVINGFVLYKVQNIETKYDNVMSEVQESREANEQVLSMLKDVKAEQQKQNEALKIVYEQKRQKAEHDNAILLIKYEGLDGNTDLGNSGKNITVEDMDRIINYYEKHTRYGTNFKNKGYVFVEAAKETGLNPIYLFAHAATESDFGTSYIANVYHNYYGINAVDNNPSAASVMGDDVDKGIISGAKWIKSNFYDNGYKTLDQMHRAGYATDKNWSKTIQSVANTSINVL